MELPSSLETNATKKTLLKVPVDGKAYYLDQENGTYYAPQIEKTGDAEEIKLRLMTQPFGEEMKKFNDALAAVLAPTAEAANPTETPEPEAPQSLPPVLQPGNAATAIPSEAPTEPEMIVDEATTDGEAPAANDTQLSQ